jgi:hypothetical protein
MEYLWRSLSISKPESFAMVMSKSMSLKGNIASPEATLLRTQTEWMDAWLKTV